MKLEHTFSVRAPIDEVWAALLDVERVAPCLPGVRLLERHGDDAYELRLDLVLGAAAVSYQGRLTIIERAPAERRAVLSFSAEADGEPRAEARVLLSLAHDGELTEGAVVADLALSGRAVAGDEGEIRTASQRLIDGFARNLAAMLGGGVATVNGADPASSTARPPTSMVELLPGSASLGPAGARPESEQPTVDAPAHAAQTPAGPPSPSPGEGSWAGATRQAGATIERLRSPLGGVMLALGALALIAGRRRRAHRSPAAAPAPPPGAPA